jgi:hypothetical protein
MKATLLVIACLVVIATSERPELNLDVKSGRVTHPEVSQYYLLVYPGQTGIDFTACYNQAYKEFPSVDVGMKACEKFVRKNHYIDCIQGIAEIAKCFPPIK